MLLNNFNPSRFMYKFWTTKRWWIPVTVAVMLAINAMGFLLPEKWASQVTVKVIEPQMSEMTGSMQRSLAPEVRLATIRDEIMTHPFLSEVATLTNLDKGMKPQSDEHIMLIGRMRNAIELRVKGRDLFTVSYRGLTPAEARDVTDQIVKLWMNRTAEFYKNTSRGRTEFLDNELQDAQLKLSESRKAVREFKEQNINSIPETVTDIIMQKDRMRAERMTAQQNLEAYRGAMVLARQRLENIQSEHISETTIHENADLARLQTVKRDMELRLQGLLVNFKEEHWQVKEVKAQLASINEEFALAQADQIETVKRAPNPAYLSLQEEITKTELTIRNIETRIVKLDSDIAKIEDYIANVPAASEELRKLEIDQFYWEERVNYFRNRLQESRLSMVMELRGLGPTFLPLNPPLLPTSPASPNRNLIFVFSVMMGACAAIAIVYLLTILDGAVRSVEEARRILQMPLLGVMQRIVTATDLVRRRRRRRRHALGWSIGLILIVGCGVVIYHLFEIQIYMGFEHLRNLVGRL